MIVHHLFRQDRVRLRQAASIDAVDISENACLIFQSIVTFAFELPLTRAQLQHEGVSRQPRGSRMRFVKTSLSNHGLATIGR